MGRQEPWQAPGQWGPGGPAGAADPGRSCQRELSSRARPGRLRRGVRVAGLVLGCAGLALSGLGIVQQLLPRTFTPAQRAQIMAWEAGKRWRAWPAGQIFPPTIGYRLPGAAFGGGAGLALTASRVGIARQARCRAATAPGVAAVLARHGCLAVLRATYDDPTKTLAVTIGVAVLPGAAAVAAAARQLRRRSRPGVRAVSFPRTPVAEFRGAAGQISWQLAAGPYLVLATVGYADGRPWLASSNDSYTREEMLSLATGVGRWVATHLGAAPAPPHCPGAPAC
jgi:hypothetical protein